MSQSRFTRAPGITAAAVLASFCAVSAQAGPVQTIFAAENALYGAGHEIAIQEESETEPAAPTPAEPEVVPCSTSCLAG